MTPQQTFVILALLGLGGWYVLRQQPPALREQKPAEPRADEHTGFPSNDAEPFQPAADSNAGRAPTYSINPLP